MISEWTFVWKDKAQGREDQLRRERKGLEILEREAAAIKMHLWGKRNV